MSYPIDTNELLQRLGERIIEINIANGWDVANPDCWNNVDKMGRLLMLVTTEVAEAMEAVRHNDKDNFIEECADIVIRVLDITTGLEMNLYQAIKDKLAVNEKRGYKHGGKRC